MDYGVPKEVRDLENRVGITPPGVHALVELGHTVYVQCGAGTGAGFTDEQYRTHGAVIVYSADEAYGRADVVAKVTRLTSAEHKLLRSGQTVLSFSHLAVASIDLVDALRERSITAIAYEMIQVDNGALPVLLTFSEMAGRLAPIIAGEYLTSTRGGRGILLSGVPGVPPASVVIVGAGALGTSAARAFLGLGAQVTMLDRDPVRLQRVDEMFRGRAATLFSTPYNLQNLMASADVLVGAVLMPGQRAPVVITREMVKKMNPRSLIIDFSIDQGGCIETSRPTTHRNPTFVEEGIIHYCVPTILSLVARTASQTLLNAALPYLQEIGSLGVEEAIQQDPSLARGVNLWKGKVVNPQISEALGVPLDSMDPAR